MEFLPVLLVLVVGAVVVLPIVALVVNASTAHSLRDEMAGLMNRIRDLEAQLHRLAAERGGASADAARPTSAQAPAQWQAASPSPIQEQMPRPPEPLFAPSATATPARPPAFTAPSSPPPFGATAAVPPPQFLAAHEDTAQADRMSLESRIGSQWFNRIGILAVLIGVAWSLKLAFDNHWIGPSGRVLSGLLAGVALIAWSERFQKRGFAVFSYSLKAIGSGTLYLSLWAAFQVYALVPAGVAFAAMIAVTAFNGLMAWTQDSELLALYAIAGAVTTPLLVSTGGNHEVTLFCYLLVLDLAVLVLAALRPWSRLLFVSGAGTAVFVVGWWLEFYSQWQAPRTAIFLGCFFLVFSLAPRLVRVPLNVSGSMPPWDALALVVLPLANAALSFLGFYCLLPSGVVDWAAPWIAVGFAAYYLLLMRLRERGILRAGSATLSPMHSAMALVFLTMAIPLKTQGRWMPVGWFLEGAVLLWLSERVRSLLVRIFGLTCLVLGLGAVLILNPPTATRPFLNERFGTYCVAIAAFAFMAWLGNRARDEDAPGIARQWGVLTIAGVLAVNALILLTVSLEIHSFWWFLWWHGDYQVFHNYEMYAQFTYSAWFMLYGAVLLAIGFMRRSAFLRWQGLLLLAATIAKVFLVDISELSRGFRVLSFIGLGVLLLCVSFVYQRDWLNLRGRKAENA